jgi:hypothetical protein
MPGEDDLIYSAEIEDNTGQYFDNFESRVDEHESRVGNAFSKIESGGAKAAAVMGIIGGAVGGLTLKLLDMAAAGAQAFVGYTKEAALFAARVETLGVAMEIAGAHAGYSKDEMGEFEEGVKGMGITTSKARIALQQMAQAELDLAKAADLARAAQDAAVVAGINSSEAFNRILYSITSLQPEILRTMNLTVNMQSEMERYARSIGKTVSQLSTADKQQAMLNATLRASEKIAGTYEATMDTVGKKLTSLPRYFEEIQLAIGQAFQPALLVGVDYLTQKLKDLTVWLEENEQQLAEFADELGDFAEWLTKTADAILRFSSDTIQWLADIDLMIGKLTYGVETRAEVIAHQQRDLETLRKQLIDFGAWVSRAAAHVVEFVRLAIDAYKPLGMAISGNLFAAMEEYDRVLAQHAVNMQEIQNQYERTKQSLGDWLSVTDEAEESTKDLGDSFDKAASDALALQNALDVAGGRLEDFARNMEEQAADLAIKMARRATEAAIRESWAREDLERRHQMRIRQIMEQAAESKRDVARRYAQSRIDIERDYQRRIRDLQRDFEFEAGELARSRDAVGLLRLMRSHNKALEDAEVGRKDSLEDAKRAFQEEVRLMNERIQEQLRRAEEAHRLQLEDFERMKARERQIQALHDKWAEEDRQAQYAKQLAELMIQMQNIEGITHDGLMGLLDLWSNYFGSLTKAATAYMKQLNKVIRPGGQYVPPGGKYDPDYHGIKPTGYGVGQGGRVSQMMLDKEVSLAQSLFQNIRPSPIPAVQPSAVGSERREITVRVSGEGLSPYIQRQVANALLEIERNASGG